MIDLRAFQNLQLRGGFTIVRLEITNEPLVDAMGRDAVARTRITARNFDLLIRAGLSQHELSVTLYHEILEAATVAMENPPEQVREFNEGDFDQAAYQAHEQFGGSFSAESRPAVANLRVLTKMEAWQIATTSRSN